MLVCSELKMTPRRLVLQVADIVIVDTLRLLAYRGVQSLPIVRKLEQARACEHSTHRLRRCP